MRITVQYACDERKGQLGLTAAIQLRVMPLVSVSNV
jgi:hypothetical protein